MTVDGAPVDPSVAVVAGVNIAGALLRIGMPMATLVALADEEWESAFVSLCAADPWCSDDYL